MLNTFSGPQFPPLFNDARIDEALRQHREFTPFAVRPITTSLIEMAQGYLRLSSVWSFMLVNFGALFVCGILQARASACLAHSLSSAILGAAQFYLSFSVLLAFFNPIDSYDDPLQYALLLAAIVSWLNGRGVLFAGAFCLACCTRESSLILIPSLLCTGALSAQCGGKGMGLRATAIALGGAVATFATWKFLFIETSGLSGLSAQYVVNDLWDHLRQNTQDMWYGAETVSMMFAVLAVPSYLLSEFLLSGRAGRAERAFAVAALLGIALNTGIVLCTGLAREARLFALPLVFFWPIAGVCAREWWRGARERLSDLAERPGDESFFWAAASLSGILVLLVAVWSMYSPTTREAFVPILRGYLSALVIVLGVLVFLGERGRGRGGGTGALSS